MTKCSCRHGVENGTLSCSVAKPKCRGRKNAQRIAPMLFACPSDVPPASETMPNGKVAEVADELLQALRHVSIKFFILHALHTK